MMPLARLQPPGLVAPPWPPRRPHGPLVMPGAARVLDLDLIGFDTTQGTIFIDLDPGDRAPSETNATLFSFDGGDGNSMNLVENATFGPDGEGGYRLVVQVSAANQVPVTAPNQIPFGPARIAVSYIEDEIILAANGAAIYTDTSCLIPALTGGWLGRNSAGSATWAGLIRKFSYRPETTAAAVLEAMTAG